MATNRVKLEDVINEAKTALEANNPDRAIALCHHVFKYYPRCLEATRVLGEAYTEKRLLDEADQLFVFVLSADPQDVLGYVDRGFIAYERGKAEEAIMYYERALELDPSIEQLREELLRLYREQYGAGRKAKIRLTKVGLANARMRDGFYGQAIEEFAGVLNETSNRLDVQVGLMEAYWRNRDYPRAEKLANELLQNNPSLVKANLILWHIYGVRRNQDRAATYLDKAHALDPLNLLAERLFEDTAVSSDAMRYISMLGVPAVPALDEAALSQAESNPDTSVPEWVNTSMDDTDVMLGLRAGAPSPLADTPSNLGFDVFALLADTEKHVSEQQEEAARAAETQEALAELDALRTSASEDKSDTIFDLFEEVETAPPPADTGKPAASSPVSPAGAFDLDFSSTSSEDLSLFEEIEPPSFNGQDFARPASSTASANLPEAQPFSLDNLDKEPEEAEPFNFDLFENESEAESFTPGLEPEAKPFSLEMSENAPEAEPFSLKLPGNGPEAEAFNFETSESELETGPSSLEAAESELETEPFSFEVTGTSPEAEPFNLEMPSESEEEAPPFHRVLEYDDTTLPPQENSAPAKVTGPLDLFDEDLFAEAPEPIIAQEPEPAPFGMAEEEVEPMPFGIAEEEPAAATTSEEGAVQANLEAADLDFTGDVRPEETAAEASEAPDDSYLNYLLEEAQPQLREETSEAAVAASTPEFTPENSTPEETRPALHAFHQRDERGPLPDFVLSASPAQAELPESFETTDQPADFLVSSSFPAEATTIEEEAAVATDLPTPATDLLSGDTPPAPQPYQEQENDAMPIKRGPEDENNVFDWEREELPDYLQAFAMDEDEVARSGLAAPNPSITDVNTSPARIRPRDDTGAPGDLPDWLNPAIGGAPGGKAIKGDQVDLGGMPRPGGGALPNWLNEADLDNQPASGKNAAGFPGMDNIPDMGGLQPFSLTDDGFGGPPPVNPPTNRAPAPPPASPAVPAFSDMDDIAPFSFDDGGLDAPTAPPAPSQPSIRNFEQPAPPRPSAPPPSAPQAAPGGFGIPGMDDLMPFSFDDDGGAAASPPPPARQAPPPPAQPAPPPRPAAPPPSPTPSFMGNDDFGDLMPFNLGGDDAGSAAPPPPARPAAPPPVSQPPANPARPFDPGANTGGFVEADLGSISPFKLGNDEPVPPPARPAPPPASPFGGMDREPAPRGPSRPAPQPSFQIPGDDDFDLEPFSVESDIPGLFGNQPDPRRGGTRGLGFGEGAIDPMETLSEQPFNPGRRAKSPEPDIQAEPGQEAPLRKFGWIQEQDRRKKEREEQEAAGNNSLFQKLAARRREMETERPKASPEPSTPVAPAGEAEEILSFEEIERRSVRPQTAPLVSPAATPSQSFQAEAFDLSDLGLNQELDDEAFSQSLDETLPTDARAAEAAQEFPALTSEPGFDFEPFDLEGIAPEAATPVEEAAPEPVVHATQPEEPSYEPTAEDFNMPDFELNFMEEPAAAAPVAQEPAFEPVEFSLEPETASPQTQSEAAPAVPAFDFAQAEEAPSSTTFDFAQAEEAPATFDFSEPEKETYEPAVEPEPEPVKPFFTAPSEPVAPVSTHETAPEPAVETTPVVQIPPEPIAHKPVPQPEPVQPVTRGNGNVTHKPVTAPLGQRPAPAAGGLEDNLHLANSYFDQGEYNQSITHFNAAIKLAGGSTLDPIAVRLKQILAQPGGDRRYHRLLGDVYKKQGQFQAALAEYSQALGGPAAGAKR